MKMTFGPKIRHMKDGDGSTRVAVIWTRKFFLTPQRSTKSNKLIFFRWGWEGIGLSMIAKEMYYLTDEEHTFACLSGEIETGFSKKWE